MNDVLLGDNLQELKKLNDNSVDLVYLDPPFFTQKKQVLKNKENKEFSFDDSWNSLSDYLDFIRIRLAECKRILKDTGSIFLHCDKTASHYLRIVLDEVFGMEMFQSEIIWSYRRWSNSKKGLLNNHQTICFYSKTKDFKFNEILQEYSPTTNVDQILTDRVRDENNKVVYKKDGNGNDVLGKAKKGVPLSDVWNIPFLNPKAKERVGYPTQKPVLLLEQIIKLVTDRNDIVLDPFCGSGTTLVAAKLLERNFIGIDCSKEAIKLSKKRLDEMIKTESHLVQVGVNSYQTKTAQELDILASLGATVVQRNNGIDGFLAENVEGKPVPVKIQKMNEDLSQTIFLLENARKTKNLDFGIVVQTHQSYELFDYSSRNFENILVISRYDLQVQAWLKEKTSRSNYLNEEVALG